MRLRSNLYRRHYHQLQELYKAYHKFMKAISIVNEA